MEPSSSAIFTNVSLFVFLLLLSGFFSSSEVVFFGANKFILKLRKGRLYSLLDRLTNRPHSLLLSILIGNEMVNVLISSYSAKLFVDTMGSAGATVSVFVASLLIFVFGEVVPKNIAYPFSTRLAPIYALIFSFVHLLLYPLRKLLEPLTEKLINYKQAKKSSTDFKDSFWEVFEMGYAQRVFDEDDKVVVDKVLALDEVLVKEVMVPKPDMFVLDEEQKVEDVFELILQKKHSRVPLYRENPDNITGILYVKDLLPIDINKGKKLSEFKKPVLFVPEVQTLNHLLEEFRSEGKQIAVVVGEHGEVVGLITLHDVLEFCFGKLPETWEGGIKQVSKDTYRIEGWVDVEELSKVLALELPEEYEYDTVSGFVMSVLGRIPEEGDEFDYDGYKFTVERMEGNRVVSVYAVRLSRETA